MVQTRLFASILLLAAAPQDKAPEPAADEIIAAVRGDLTPVFELEGHYEPVESREFKAHFEAFTGELQVTAAAAHGAAVKKGDLILSVDRTPIERLIAAAGNEVRGARASADKARGDLDLAARSDAAALAQAETALRDAETQSRVYAEVEGRHQLENADLLVRYAEEGVADQKEELDQLLKMYKTEELTNATSEIVVRRTRRQMERAETFLRMQREEAKLVKTVRHPQQLNQLKQAVAVAQTALDTLRSQQALSKIQREIEAVKTQAALQQQEEQLAKLRHDLERLPFKAPFDGTVYCGAFQQGQWGATETLQAALRPGEKLPTGQVLLTVCGAATRIRADIAEVDYFEIHPGMSASALPLADPEAKLEGTLASKAPTSVMRGPGAVFEARIDLKEPPVRLLPGMKAKVTLKGRELKGVVLVPLAAVQTAGTKSTVAVQKDGKPQPREVVAGRGDGKRISIRSGLEAGEKVVVPK